MGMAQVGGLLKVPAEAEEMTLPLESPSPGMVLPALSAYEGQFAGLFPKIGRASCRERV